MSININGLGVYSQITGDSAQILNKTDVEINGTDTYKGRFRAMFRSRAERRANNAMRSDFLKALGDTYGVSGYQTEKNGRIHFDSDFVTRLKKAMGVNMATTLRLDDAFAMRKGYIVCGKPLTERRVSVVVKSVKASYLEQLSRQHSSSRSEMPEAVKQAFLKSLFAPGVSAYKRGFFDGSMEQIHTETEKDLNRDQVTIIGEEKFGGKNWKTGKGSTQSADYRAKLTKFCNGDEGLMRFFGGIMSQTFHSSATFARTANVSDLETLMRIQTPFADTTDGEFKQSQTFHLTKNGNSYSLDVSFRRSGTYSPSLTHKFDPSKSFDEYHLKLNVTKVEEGTPGARHIAYKDEAGNQKDLYLKCDISKFETESKFAYES